MNRRQSVKGDKKNAHDHHHETSNRLFKSPSVDCHAGPSRSSRTSATYSLPDASLLDPAADLQSSDITRVEIVDTKKADVRQKCLRILCF